MPKHSTPGHSSLTKSQKISIAGVATLGAAALAFSFVPGNHAEATQAAEVSAAPVAFTTNVHEVKASVTKQQVAAGKKADDAQAAADKKAKEDAKAEAEAKKEREAKEAASRAAARKPVYANNLDGWIRQSLDIMKSKGIPGTYDGIHRNVMRESTGNPNAINNWDINAQNGTPSIGLLQVIQPTFNAYHVEGTAHNLYDPVANIVAASNYAADRYGSIDNVNSAY
ncbi:transglycosylase SLT domain-containing protein [Streptomyces sp. NBC_01304]|uniref:transglycosylase SLT domain-containing protein n=1 Tax=Streptomyces sp. NBC_01304 TaxID=2903818 RepID=UPI002E1193C0|nr:transglycosylase SLT domain-containing protein [Streptomyces sp. NBC_01304]